MHAILNPMGRILRAFILLLVTSGLHAQIYEVGVFVGGSNVISDVGATNYIKPNDLAFGGIFKWNKSPRHSWRASLIHAEVSADDADSDAPNRNQRGYKFSNTVTELSAGLEFDFFDFDTHALRQQFTPYVYSGLSYFRYNSLYIENGKTERDGKRNVMALPMVVGVKSNVTHHLVLAFEVGARFTFVDDLDGSNPENEDYAGLKFGNYKNKDWYVFTGFTLTYTFGNNPCFCPQ